MKIAIANHEYSRTGGVERHTVELAERLAARGHDVHYFGAVAPERPGPGVTFRKVFVPTWPNSLRMVSFAARAAVHISRLRGTLSISPGSIAGADITVAQSCHAAGLAIPEAVELRSKGRKNWGIADRIRLRMEQRIYAGRRYRKIVAVSHGVSREIQQLYQVPAEDIVVIPNGVDVEHFHPRLRETSGGKLRFDLGIPPDQRLLLFVGHEFRRKGLEVLVQALGRLAGDPWMLLVAGDDDPTPYLSQARDLGIAEKIVFLGKVGDTAPLYAAADLFVFPTAYEAWPLAMVEAAASGLPLVITGVSGVEEFLVDGRNGFFVERNEADVADKIAMLLHDEGLRRRLGAEARMSAETCSWERIVDDFEAVLGRLSPESPRP